MMDNQWTKGSETIGIAKRDGCKTVREWKALKRKQLRNVTSAMDEFYYGSAYLPRRVDKPGNSVRPIYRELEELQEAMRQKNWG